MLVFFCTLALTLGPVEAASHSDRLDLFPKLQAGQAITYRIAYHLERQTKTQGSVTWAQTPAAADVNVQGRLRVDILGVKAEGQRSSISARTWFQVFHLEAQPAAATAAPSATQKSLEDARGMAVEFTISPDGRIDKVNGIDALSAGQQQAWRQWATTFGAAAAFPASGIKLAQKWKSEEPEKSPAPIAGLIWTRESTYLRNEPCRITQAAIQGDAADASQPPETCAVIETTALLKQKSSTKNSTPEDFKLHQLRTSGAATGSNKTLLYISLQTGLVVRAFDQADQSMNVTIAKSDGSNHVRYDIHAKSITDIFRIANAAPNNP
jgi:hypothetical protein